MCAISSGPARIDLKPLLKRKLPVNAVTGNLGCWYPNVCFSRVCKGTFFTERKNYDTRNSFKARSIPIFLARSLIAALSADEILSCRSTPSKPRTRMITGSAHGATGAASCCPHSYFQPSYYT